jgi:uncharacterized membrane protein YphA (DoxX/SURF4 family)
MRLLDLYLLLIRLLLGYIFASAGLCKLTGGMFGQLIGPPTADMLPGLEGIWPFLAVSQVLVGALVLSGRWSLLGLLALLPLNVGILAYTIGNHWTGTPFVNGFFVLLNLLALAAEWPSLRFLVVPGAPMAPPRLIELWPGWQLPVLTIGLLGAAAVTALAQAPVAVTGLLGAAGCAVAWVHALRSPTGLTRLDRLVLALPGVAVVWLSLMPALSMQSVAPVMVLGVLSGALALVVLTGQRGWARWRRYSSARP